MSDEAQGDLLEQMVAAGLADEDDRDAPAVSTQTPGDTAPDDDGSEQMEFQPVTADGRTWKGAEHLRPYLVRIEDLKPTEGNPFKGKAHVGRLQGSLVRFGQTRPILTDAEDSLTIRAGHHLTLAAEELGWTHMAAIPAEFSDKGEALAFLLADNRLARVGDEDVSIVQQLTMLDLIGETNLEGTGWDLDSVETMRAEAGATPVVAETEPWGGDAAETAEEANARAKALEGYEPHKEIPLYMTLPEHERYSEHVRLLKQAWSLGGSMAVILRALQEAYDREAAPISTSEYDEPAGTVIPLREPEPPDDETAAPETVGPEATGAAAEPVAEPGDAGSSDGGEGSDPPESATAPPDDSPV